MKNTPFKFGNAWFKALLVSGVALSSLGTGSANATIVSLDFENINSSYPFGSTTQILDFYNGGLSSVSTTGTNYGVSFGANALNICLNTLGFTGCSNTSRGGIGDPTSERGGLFFLDGSETYLNYPSGFDTGFSFNYVSFSYSGSVNVYDDLNGLGNILATLNLNPNAGSCPGYTADYCPFSPIGVLFSGTAKSIGFGGVANQIAFDDVTFGSATPDPGPNSVPGPLPIGGAALGFSFTRKLRNRIKLNSNKF
jgi:hypothetical protein